jgi:hypothetical protein
MSAACIPDTICQTYTSLKKQVPNCTANHCIVVKNDNFNGMELINLIKVGSCIDIISTSNTRSLRLITKMPDSSSKEEHLSMQNGSFTHIGADTISQLIGFDSKLVQDGFLLVFVEF